MKNVIFFHIALVGKRYQEIVDIMFKDIYSSGILPIIDKIYVSILGNGKIFLPEEKIKVIKSGPPQQQEFPTLALLREYCYKNPEDNVLYLHNAGSTSKIVNPCLEDRRSYMNYFNITKFWDSLKALETHVTCGVDLMDDPVLHYSGNMWWARANHVNKLPAPEELPIVLDHRHKAEFWICSDGNKEIHKCLWHSGTSGFARHLHRYPKENYIT